MTDATTKSTAIAPALDKLKGVLTERADNYDGPDKNFERIAALWSVILGRPTSKREVGLCMIAVKIARLMHDYTDDSALDIAGYAMCILEIEHLAQERTA
jgi:hypothetical protein